MSDPKPTPIWKKVGAVERLWNLSVYITRPNKDDVESGYTAELKEEFDELIVSLREWGWTEAAAELEQIVTAAGTKEE